MIHVPEWLTILLLATATLTGIGSFIVIVVLAFPMMKESVEYANKKKGE